MQKKILIIGFILLSFSSSALAWKNALFTNHHAYYKTLQKFTRHDNDISIDNLNAKMQWYATYKSPEFTQAFLSYYQELYPHPSENLANQKAKLWSEKAQQAEFFIALYAQSRDLEKLDHQSLWDLSLQVGNQSYKPVRIEKINASSFEKKFFPYLESWHQSYRVVFAVTPPASTSLNLQISGAGGSSVLRF